MASKKKITSVTNQQHTHQIHIGYYLTLSLFFMSCLLNCYNYCLPMHTLHKFLQRVSRCKTTNAASHCANEHNKNTLSYCERKKKEEKNCVDYYSFAHCAHWDEVIARPLITQAHIRDGLVISTKKWEVVPNWNTQGRI